MSEHQHDENCGCEDDGEEQIFSITDDEGNELEMVMVYSFESDDHAYAVLLDRNNLEADGVIFRIEEENDESFLVSIDDDEEWERVVSIYNQISEGQAT
ncbi:MAG TPA: DUF1292 domain-containing protein [Bacilli bacterium]